MTTHDILSHYDGLSSKTLKNLTTLLNHGRLKGTGKLLISAVDQGFEHGPSRSFASNLQAFDPYYHFEMAVDGGLSAFAAPLGMLEVGCAAFGSKIPTILKMNSSNALSESSAPTQAMTASVADAVRLGCVGIGYTLYPGSANNDHLIEGLQRVSHDAKEAGLVVVAWSYPRGNLSKEGETALDVVAYGAHMACLLGAHIVKVKIPTAHIEKAEDKKAFEQHLIPHTTLEDRIRYVVKCSFAGRRMVIFSGGTTKSDGEVLDEAQAIANGGGFGSIIGRNIFQRPRQDALNLIKKITDIYRES